MESANVQVLRKLEELFNGRDLDAYLELLRSLRSSGTSSRIPTRPCMTVARRSAYLEGWIDAFADLRIQTEIVSEAGDRVLT